MIKRKIAAGIFRVCDALVPGRRELWVFAGQSGWRYADNSRYLFLHAVQQPDIEAVYFSTCPHERARIEAEVAAVAGAGRKVAGGAAAGRAVHPLSLRGLWLLLRARVVFVTHGFGDVKWLRFGRRKVLVQLWHGINLKRVGLLDHKFDARGAASLRQATSRRRARRLQREGARYSLICASSQIDAYQSAACFGVPFDRMMVTGLARNDYLVEKRSPQAEPVRGVLDGLGLAGAKVILYAPTFRDQGQTRYFPFDDFDQDDLQGLLVAEGAWLLLRGHSNDAGALPVGGRVIAAGQDRFEDVQELLPFVDVLISDYSSLFMDYLLLDRPVIFLPYDLQEYSRERGLLYDYDLVTPGAKPDTYAAFREDLLAALREPGRDAKQRQQVRQMFHAFQDGKACERITQQIKELVCLI